MQSSHPSHPINQHPNGNRKASFYGEHTFIGLEGTPENVGLGGILQVRMIDLFCGAGGLSIGLEAAGFRSILAVEMNQDACKTYQARFEDCDLKPVPIQTLDFKPYRGKVQLVAGGPPCQPFSSGGKSLAQDDHRNMVPEFMRVVSEVEPPLFVMENVPGLVAGAKRTYLDLVLRQFQALGYQVTWEVLSAADYGVPQKRRRLFIVGSKTGSFRLPRPTHGPETKNPYVTSRTFLSTERVIGTPNTAIVTYAKNPDVRPSPYDGLLFNGGGRPINLEALCPTILASAGGNKTPFIDTLGIVPGYHEELRRGARPREGVVAGARRITVEESALIQTFPRDMRFYGSRSSQYTQVGNAVPPLLARRVGEALSSLLSTRVHEASAD